MGVQVEADDGGKHQQVMTDGDISLSLPVRNVFRVFFHCFKSENWQQITRTLAYLLTSLIEASPGAWQN